MNLVPCILYRISTNEIINFNYPVSDEYLPPLGLDPDLKVYAKFEPFPEPAFDARVFKLVITNELTNTPHPTYPQVNQYKRTYSEEKRSKEELKIAVDDACFYANQSIYDYFNSDNFQSKSITILYKKVNGQTLEQWELDVLNEVSNIAAKIQNNENVKAQKYAAIDSEIAIDIDLGWIYQ